MGYEELSLSGFINEFKDVNVGPHPRKFCFILGAGASIVSGIKSGQELVNIWDEELSERNNEEYLKWKEKFEINDTNKYSFYSQYYEKRFEKHPSDGYNYLEKLMGNAKPSIGYIMLAYLLTQTSNNVVITTNFDHLLEDAINFYAQTIPLVIGHENLVHYISSQITRPTIIKIHRDLLFNPANRTYEVDKLHDNWKIVLETIFRNYNPIFIGYAGNDNSLMNYLISNSDKFCDKSLCVPYWMLYNKDKIDGKVKEFLEKSGSYFIKHNGFDETIYRIAAALNIKMPTRDQLIADAEQRYQVISNSINAFTQKIYDVNETHQNDLLSVDNSESGINSAVLKITDQAQALKRFREACVLYRNKKYDQALDIVNELLKLNPNNSQYYNLKGRNLSAMTHYDDALSAFHKAIELEPDNASFHNGIGIVYLKKKSYDNALLEYGKAIELDPNNALYHNLLGEAYVEIQHYEEALSECYKSIELEPENAFYHACIGQIYFKMQQYDQALEKFYKSTKLNPKVADYHNYIANTYEELERYDEAVLEYHKAIELEPEKVKYHVCLGDLYDKTQHKDMALSEYYKARELAVNDTKYDKQLNEKISKLENETRC